MSPNNPISALLSTWCVGSMPLAGSAIWRVHFCSPRFGIDGALVATSPSCSHIVSKLVCYRRHSCWRRILVVVALLSSSTLCYSNRRLMVAGTIIVLYRWNSSSDSSRWRTCMILFVHSLTICAYPSSLLQPPCVNHGGSHSWICSY